MKGKYAEKQHQRDGKKACLDDRGTERKKRGDADSEENWSSFSFVFCNIQNHFVFSYLLLLLL